MRLHPSFREFAQTSKLLDIPRICRNLAPTSKVAACRGEAGGGRILRDVLDPGVALAPILEPVASFIGESPVYLLKGTGTSTRRRTAPQNCLGTAYLGEQNAIADGAANHSKHSSPPWPCFLLPSPHFNVQIGHQSQNCLWNCVRDALFVHYGQHHTRSRKWLRLSSPIWANGAQ